MIEIRQGGKKENLELEIEAKCQEEMASAEVKEPLKETANSCQPKNFRQIGSPSGQQKIYFEDYVYTYLHPLFETQEETRVGILLGHIKKENDTHYIFVSGAMELPGIEFAGNTPIFVERIREDICTLMKHHFDGQYLVGWYLDLKGNVPKLTPELERIHRNFFGGRNKIFLLSDSLNREEKLFACENNAIWQKDGYYIYYEKNPQMQDYMIATREEKKNTIQPEEVVDEALKNYREILLQKEEREPKKYHRAFYATSFLLIITICVFGVNMINNYDKMKQLEGALSVLSGSVVTETEQLRQETETENGVVIETIDGEITKNTEEIAKKDTEISTEEDTEEIAEKEPVVTTTQPLSEGDTIRLQGYYIVQKGENLAAISRKIYGDTSWMQALCEKNGIENSDQIYAGQKLLLP